MPALLADKMC